MYARLITLMLIVTLTLPAASLVPPGTPGNAPWTSGSVVAKGKKHKHKKPRKRNAKQPTAPAPAPITRTKRGSVTQTIISDIAGPIAIPAGAPGTTKGNANPYPAAMAVSGFANGVITDIDVILQDFSHAVPMDVDILLIAPDGRRALVMSDAGRIIRATNVDLVLDDEAATALGQGELVSGVYRPTDISSAGDIPDAFDAPAPALNGSVALNTFNGADPNGTWQLFIVDDTSGDTGDLRGWALRITAEVDTGTVSD